MNVFGGVAVLASYADNLARRPELSGALWGGVPEGLKPFYFASMLLAAAGYFAFSGFFLVRLGSNAREPLANPRVVIGLYAAILAPSALWMPLTSAFLESPSDAVWVAIRIVLAIVGLASVALLAVLWAERPDRRRSGWRLAVGGLLAFCLQTALLDALVWPHFFRG